MAEDAIASLAPLAADVRAQDPDRYLATLFAPPETRDALFALYAFNHEIAKVRWMVREPMVGLIRLQWWRDALDGIDRNDVLAHPVVQGLHRAISVRGLERAGLDLAIDAREQELEAPPPADLPALERHLAATSGTVVRAALSILGERETSTLGIGDLVGSVLGLLELSRWLGREDCLERAERTLWLPKAWLAEHDLEVEGLGEAEKLAKIRAVQARLSGLARDHLAIARKDRPAGGARGHLSAFFPATLAETRFRDLAKASKRPAAASAPIRLVWCWLRNRF
ncbi:MAG: phytoene/squalene synthase family protein [Geminicoccaceae bacterium]